MAETIQRIHSKGIVHGDINPEHMMANDEEVSRISLINFDFAHHSEQEHVGGSLLYQSPELLLNQNPSPFSIDMWALALSILEIEFGNCIIDYKTTKCLERVILAKYNERGINYSVEHLSEKMKGCVQSLQISLEKAFTHQKKAIETDCGADTFNHFFDLFRNVLAFNITPENRPNIVEGLNKAIESCSKYRERVGNPVTPKRSLYCNALTEKQSSKTKKQPKKKTHLLPIAYEECNESDSELDANRSNLMKTSEFEGKEAELKEKESQKQNAEFKAEFTEVESKIESTMASETVKEVLESIRQLYSSINALHKASPIYQAMSLEHEILKMSTLIEIAKKLGPEVQNQISELIPAEQESSEFCKILPDKRKYDTRISSLGLLNLEILKVIHRALGQLKIII